LRATRCVVSSRRRIERRRLARELHDETAQALTSILLGLKRIEDIAESDDTRAALSELREAVVGALQDVRRLAVELRPRALDDFGLVAALERLTGGIAEQGEIEVEFESRLPDTRLPEEIETVLYRVIQEALNNVLKHADAKQVSVVLARKDGAVTAFVEDDGRGFVPDKSDDSGVGLVGMRERVALVDGRLTVESSEGEGTTVVVEVPLP
jgi:signal transduction histidine kinase